MNYYGCVNSHTHGNQRYNISKIIFEYIIQYNLKFNIKMKERKKKKNCHVDE